MWINIGWALAAAISCASVCTGELLATAITTGTRPTSEMGVMSRARSYGGGWYSDTLAANALAASISVPS